MEPTPGGQLEAIYNEMADPALVMVARLAKGPLGESEESVDLTTLVEADFPGYAPVVLTPDLTDAWEEDGYGELSPQIVVFNVGTLVTAQLITHLYVTKTYNGAALSLVMAVPFAQPILVNQSDTTVEFDVGIAGLIEP